MLLLGRQIQLENQSFTFFFSGYIFDQPLLLLWSIIIHHIELIHCSNMVIRRSIDEGQHDVYSAMDVDFARQFENDGPAPLHNCYKFGIFHLLKSVW